MFSANGNAITMPSIIGLPFRLLTPRTAGVRRVNRHFLHSPSRWRRHRTSRASRQWRCRAAARDRSRQTTRPSTTRTCFRSRGTTALRLVRSRRRRCVDRVVQNPQTLTARAHALGSFRRLA
jgi:hypothetical protein